MGSPLSSGQCCFSCGTTATPVTEMTKPQRADYYWREGLAHQCLSGQEERLSNCNLTTSSKRKWLNMSPHEPMVRNFRRLGHAPPILTMHTDVSPQLLVRGVRTCRNKDTSWCVCVCLCRHHCEAQGLALQHVLVSGFPTAVETGVQQLDLLPLCARCERECRSTTGH